MGRKIKKILVIGSLGIGAFLFFASWQQVNFVLSPPRNQNSFFFFTPQSLGLPYEKFALTIEDEKRGKKEKIFGWFIPGEKDSCIIFIPGWGGSKEGFLKVSYKDEKSPLQILWEKGFSLCLFDPRGSGESEGSFDMGLRLDEDTKAIIDFLSLEEKISRFILVGFSAGANAAIRVALERKEIVATIADSPFVSIFNTKSYPKILVYLFYFLSWPKLGRDWPKGLDLSQKDLSKLSNIFLIAGEKDKITPPEEARFIFERAKEPKELWIVENADHCQAIFLFPKEYLQAVFKFLERVLAQRTLFC